jgi:cob(I)alamin adenosyltransferase
LKIATKTGDDGTTGLLFGRRRSKKETVFYALGDLDETSAFIGLAKAQMKGEFEHRFSHYIKYLSEIQKQIISIMGECNCLTKEEVDKYLTQFSGITYADMHELDKSVEFLQDLPELKQTDWVLYGSTKLSALLDVSSKVCRRAERSMIWAELPARRLVFQYVNRLSDFLYLLARLVEK